MSKYSSKEVIFISLAMLFFLFVISLIFYSYTTYPMM
jgi:hypothetical protein